MSTALMIIIVSAIFIVIGARLWQKGKHLATNGKKAKAIIFKNNFQAAPGGGFYHPVVRFTTDKQEWITQELSIGYLTAKPEGTKLEVMYDPDDPTNVEISSKFQLRIVPGLFVAIGLMGFILGGLAYLNIIQFITD